MKTNIETNVKRNVLVTVGGLFFIGLLTMGISTFGNRMNFIYTAQAQEETKSDADEILLPSRNFDCSNATLAGRYAFIGDGFVPGGPPPAPMVPFATVGILTLDGRGNLSDKATVSNNGQISQNVNPGTYTVNADCTGTMTITIPGLPFQLTFNLVVADLQTGRSKEFYFIGTTPSVVTHTAKRIQ